MTFTFPSSLIENSVPTSIATFDTKVVVNEISSPGAYHFPLFGKVIVPVMSGLPPSICISASDLVAATIEFDFTNT